MTSTCTRPLSRLLTFAQQRSATSFAAAVTAAAPAPVQDAPLPAFWSGVLAVEGQATGDGRLIEVDALEWTTPVTLRYAPADVGGHDGAVVVGRILSIERGEDGRIEATGDFDLSSEIGREAARHVSQKLTNGISLDLDSVSAEVRLSKEAAEAEIKALEEFNEYLETGEAPEPDLETREDGSVVVQTINNTDEIFAMTAARVRGATIVSIPAFDEAMIFGAEELPEVARQALVASAAPVDPPAAWFTFAEADAPTPLTITDEGHVYGHLATWDQCHIGDPQGGGVCIMAPKSSSAYAYFHTGVVKTSEGSMVETGTVRFNTGHAGMTLDASSAASHYDHTGLVGADVHATDGKFGIWVTGAIRPNVTPEQLRTLRAAPLSGDWRYVGGTLELVGALAVNVPGFPVPRPGALVASGDTMTALVAAGMIAPAAAPAAALPVNSADAAYLSRMIERERTREQRELAQRVATVAARERVRRFAAESLPKIDARVNGAV